MKDSVTGYTTTYIFYMSTILNVETKETYMVVQILAKPTWHLTMVNVETYSKYQQLLGGLETGSIATVVKMETIEANGWEGVISTTLV